VNPFQSLQAQWQERTQFVAEMISKFEERAPEQVLDEPIDRFGALIAQLYILDPQFAEAANYSEATESYEMDYNASFFHSLFRGFFWGGLLLLFTILGIVYWVFELRKESVQLNNQITLLLLSSLALLCALLWAIPLPFQRYYVPLIPPICLWSSLGLILTYQISKQAFFKIRRPVVEH
jgi:hypothetical protein